MNSYLRRALAIVALACATTSSQAAGPPIRIVVSFSPGGPIDIGARLLAAKLAKVLDQPVVVENKPGGNATIGALAVARAPADGHTYYMQSVSTVSKVFVKKLTLDFGRDFVPVAPIWSAAYVLFVNDKVPVVDFPEFLNYAKSNDKLNYSYGTASSLLSMEMLKSATGIKAEAIPYKGSAPASMALLADEVQMSFDVPAVYQQQIAAGTVRPLLYTGPTRSRQLPNVPTAKEAGYPDIQVTFTGGLWAPAGTPEAALTRMRKALDQVLRDPDVAQRFDSMGWTLHTGTPKELEESVQAELKFWETAAQLANYHPDN